MEKKELLEEINRLKQQILELKEQIIDFELPKNYDKMSEDEKKAYQKKQDKLKQDALNDMDNYSVIIKDYTIYSCLKKKNILSKFSQDVGSLDSLPLERDSFGKHISEKYKELHKNNLKEIENLIDRYNSTKAIRNDRIEFGSNFNNFIETYFSKQSSDMLDKQSNTEFLKTYDKQLDKNGNVIGDKFKLANLTEDQRKSLIKIRIKLFAEKLNKLQKIAEKKVKNDTKQKYQTFLDLYGYQSSNMEFRDGTKKLTTTKSVISNTGVDMAKHKKRKNKEDNGPKSELFSNATTSSNRDEINKNNLIEINVMKDKFKTFVKNYKGNGRQFSVEFSQSFPKLASKLYIKKGEAGTSFRNQNLESSPISVQQHEIEKQIEDEIKKINNRIRYSSYFIPATEGNSASYLGKYFSNAKTQTEKNLDKMKVVEYERELKNINMREDLVSFDILYENLNKALQKDFEKYKSSLKKDFGKMSDVLKKKELKKFISMRIEKLKETVHKNKFLSLGTEKVEKLNGVLIDRSDKIVTKDVKDIFDSLGTEQAEIYKHLIQSVKEFTSKIDFEKNTIEKLSDKLDLLSNKPYSVENNNQIQKLVSDINSHNKKMSIIKASLANAQNRKNLFESNFASEQINKAMASETSKAVSFNTSKSVFDKYSFPALDAFGETYEIKKDSLEGKQIEKIIGSFIMNFKNQVQNMRITFVNYNNVEILDYISRLESRLEDDFGPIIRDLKKTQKIFGEVKEKSDKNKDKSFILELEKFIQRLNKIETDLIKKMKSMNVEIGDITLIKKGK